MWKLEFMEILERETFKKDKRYVVPFPFRDPNLMLPNHKKQAILRLIKTQNNFSEAQRLFQDYLKVMDNLTIIG